MLSRQPSGIAARQCCFPLNFIGFWLLSINSDLSLSLSVKAGSGVDYFEEGCMASLAVLSLFDFARFLYPLRGQKTKFLESRCQYRAAFLLICVLALTPVLTWAQATSTGTVVGLVTDPTGAI